MEENNSNPKKEPQKNIVIKVVLACISIVLAVLLIRELLIVLDLYMDVKNEADGIVVDYSLTEDGKTSDDSVSIAQQVKEEEYEKMKKLGIADEVINEVVIKNGEIFNYEKLEDYYNNFLATEGMYQGIANNALKVIKYADDTNYNETIIKIETTEINEIKYQGTITITVDGNTYEKDYYLTPIWRSPVKDDEGDLFIEYYFFDEGNRVDLFKYRLSSTSYLGSIDFRFSDNGSQKVEERFQASEVEGSLRSIYVVGGVLKVLERGTEEPVLLEEALNNEILTYDRVLKIAEADSCYGKCNSAMFKDGGSKSYEYADFIIYELVIMSDMMDPDGPAHYDKLIVFAPKDMTIDEAKALFKVG